MKKLLPLMAMMAIGALAGAPSVLAAGAYSTGVGQGYNSYASANVLLSGTIFTITRIIQAPLAPRGDQCRIPRRAALS